MFSLSLIFEFPLICPQIITCNCVILNVWCKPLNTLTHLDTLCMIMCLFFPCLVMFCVVLFRFVCRALFCILFVNIIIIPMSFVSVDFIGTFWSRFVNIIIVYSFIFMTCASVYFITKTFSKNVGMAVQFIGVGGGGNTKFHISGPNWKQQNGWYVYLLWSVVAIQYSHYVAVLQQFRNNFGHRSIYSIYNQKLK